MRIPTYACWGPIQVPPLVIVIVDRTKHTNMFMLSSKLCSCGVISMNDCRQFYKFPAHYNNTSTKNTRDNRTLDNISTTSAGNCEKELYATEFVTAGILL